MRIDPTNFDAILRERAGVTLETAVRRVLARFDAATPSDLEAGAQWYGGAESIVATMSRVTGRSAETCAAVVAHASPRTTWQRNLAVAWAILTTAPGESAFDRGRSAGGMGGNVSRAVAALDAIAPLATLNGPKTAAFARNITGDRDAVTVDVWAVRAALSPNYLRGTGDNAESILSRGGVYGAVAQAYRIAARRRGVDPTTMQATVWVVVRNGRAA